MKYKHIIAVVSIFIAFSSCTKDFDTLIKDPIALEPNPNGQLTFVQMSMSGDRYTQWRYNVIYSGGFVQHYTGPWNTTTFGGQYQKDDGYAHALWIRSYSIELKNLADILLQTEGDPEQANINAIAKITRVMVGQRLTDLYGDIPYSEAGGGFSLGVTTPVYDKQEDIYASFFVDLEESFNQLNANGGAVPGDLFYNGDISKWKKLANTLRLRLGMRLSEVAPAIAEAQVKAAVANGVFTSNADNTVMEHGDIGFNGDIRDFRGNGLAHAFVGNGGNDKLTKTVIDYLQDRNDPRLPILAKERALIPAGQTKPYAGVPAGQFSYEPQGGDPATSFMQPYFQKYDQPFLHVSYSETKLLMAEAAFRGWISPGQQFVFYNEGVEAGIKQLEMYKDVTPASQADIDTYLANNPLVAGTEMEQISSQLWITYIFRSNEAYSNWRRTGFPVLTPSTAVASETNGVIPTRFYYPLDELQKNEVNYLDALSRMGGTNDWLNKVWWDAN